MILEEGLGGNGGDCFAKTTRSDTKRRDFVPYGGYGSAVKERRLAVILKGGVPSQCSGLRPLRGLWLRCQRATAGSDIKGGLLLSATGHLLQVFGIAIPLYRDL